MGKGNDIIIAFKTVALEKAKALADDIDKRVKSALKNIKDVRVRKQYRDTQRGIAEERRADIQRRERDLNLARRGDALAGRDSAAFGQDARRGANQARSAAGKAGRLLGIAQSGDITGALSLLGAVPGLGAVAAAAAGVAAVARVVLPILQKELDAKFKAQENRSLLRQQQAFIRADPARRFREDPDFRDQQTRKAVREAMQADAAARGGGWRRRGRYTVPE